MTFADVTYGLWSLVAAAALALWLLSTLGRYRVARPTVALRSLLTHPAMRAAVILGWLWLGWHTFAR